MFDEFKSLHVQCSGLELDESSFTGETVPCQKQSEPVVATKGELSELTNIAFMGTLVCNGNGRGVVIGTGYNTQFGEIFTLMESEVSDSEFCFPIRAFVSPYRRLEASRSYLDAHNQTVTF